MPYHHPPTTPSPTSFESLLSSALPFLRGELSSVDPKLPFFISVLQSVGAGECWHKHCSFQSHLLDVYRVLKLWSVPDPVALCGLFHSACSISNVNLAIFDPTTSRSHVRSLIGPDAEKLVHLFCGVNRLSLVHDDILFKYKDAELVEHLALSSVSVDNARETEEFDLGESWRKKIREIVPAEGVIVKLVKTGEDVKVSRRVVALFLLMTMVDFKDQLFDWQDQLFENTNGRLEFAGSNPLALWPGNGKPGLWMNYSSRIGGVYTLIAREEEIYMLEKKKKNNNNNSNNVMADADDDRDESLDLVIPPVFDNCTRIIDAKEQIVARDLYWEVVSGGGGDGWLEKAEELLRMSIEKNPFVGESRILLAQVYLGTKRFEEAEVVAEKGVKLLGVGDKLGQEDGLGSVGGLGKGTSHEGKGEGLASVSLGNPQPWPCQLRISVAA